MNDRPVPRFNGCADILGASSAGACLGGLLLSVSAGMVGDGGPDAAIGLAPLIAFFIWPIWLGGVTLLGLPIRRVLATFGASGPLTAILLRASLVGLAWAATNLWGADSSPMAWRNFAWNSAAGAASGGFENWVAWFVGHQQPEASK